MWISTSWLRVWAIWEVIGENWVGGSTNKGVVGERYHYDQCEERNLME
jgi:hypothetical protein